MRLPAKYAFSAMYALRVIRGALGPSDQGEYEDMTQAYITGSREGMRVEGKASELDRRSEGGQRVINARLPELRCMMDDGKGT